MQKNNNNNSVFPHLWACIHNVPVPSGKDTVVPSLKISWLTILNLVNYIHPSDLNPNITSLICQAGWEQLTYTLMSTCASLDKIYYRM